MQLPVCEICALTGVLCKKCEENLNRGKIRPEDVEVSRAIYILSRKYPLRNVEIVRSIDTGREVVIFVKNSPGRLIGRGGVIAKEISEFLGRRVRVEKWSDEPLALVQALLKPLKVVGVSFVFRKEGEICKVKIARTKGVDQARLSELVGAILNKECEIELV